MTFGTFYGFCLNLCGQDASMPFDSHTVVFKKKGKVFAIANSNDFQFVNLKCDPGKSINLREHHNGIKNIGIQFTLTRTLKMFCFTNSLSIHMPWFKSQYQVSSL